MTKQQRQAERISEREGAPAPAGAEPDAREETLIATDEDGAIRPWEDAEALQRALEARLRRLSGIRGAARLAERIARGAESETGYGARAVAEGIDALAAAIRRDREEASGRRGPRPAALRRLDALEPETAAYLTLRAALDRLAAEPTLTAAAQSVGALAEEELAGRALREAAPAEARRLAAAAPGRLRKDRLRASARRQGVAAWSPRERQLAGLRLLNLMLETTALAAIEEDVAALGGGRTRTVKRLVAGPALVASRAAAEAAAAAIAPLREPMTVPPKPWRDAYDGGYLTEAARPLTLVKTREKSVLEALTPARAPVAFAAVNAAQETAWAVNGEVLRALEATLLDPAAALAVGLPAAEPEERPEPEGEERPEREAKAARRAWAEGERRRRSRRWALERLLAQARRHRALPAIYFPYQMDFRGRLYAVPDFSPQGPDPMKALLRFARGRRLGEEGWKWLAIHLCNCGDFEKMSKAPLAARAEWTLANEERILTVAADPLADLWWTEADHPWQFLAACFEWAGFCAEGEDFVSHLPVALDGSCSGIQHFSLALRDEVGGAAVNLTAEDAGGEGRAADIYLAVAAAARGLLEADLDSAAVFAPGEGEAGGAPVAELARQWLAFGVTRGLCKRPTMTYGYGARAYGYVEQILEDTLEPARAAHEADPDRPWPFEGRGFLAALYMAARLTEAIERTVLKAAEAMRWLQEVAALAASEGRPLSWTAPDGFPVLQAYRERRDRRVKTLLAGRPIRLTLREETHKLDLRRQKQGVAPNYVHALDACHLRLTVARAAEEGMRDFALVHDSFGVHAAETPRFFELIRETLVEMYDAADVVSAFRDEIASQLSEAGREALAEPPEPGALDLGAVLDSEHCFS